MLVRVRLFAVMAQQAGASQLSLDLPGGASLAKIRAALTERFPNLPWPPGTLLALNQEYASPEQSLRENDEVAVIPPVSGG